MLVLSRKNRETVVVGGIGGVMQLLKVTVVEIDGTRVKLGFEADDDIPINRLEVWERICAEGEASQPTAAPAVRAVPYEDKTPDANRGSMSLVKRRVH